MPFHCARSLALRPRARAIAPSVSPLTTVYSDAADAVSCGDCDPDCRGCRECDCCDRACCDRAGCDEADACDEPEGCGLAEAVESPAALGEFGGAPAGAAVPVPPDDAPDVARDAGASAPADGASYPADTLDRGAAPSDSRAPEDAASSSLQPRTANEISSDGTMIRFTCMSPRRESSGVFTLRAVPAYGVPSAPPEATHLI